MSGKCVMDGRPSGYLYLADAGCECARMLTDVQSVIRAASCIIEVMAFGLFIL